MKERRSNISIPDDPEINFFARADTHPDYDFSAREDMDENFRHLHERIFDVEEKIERMLVEVRNAPTPNSGRIQVGSRERIPIPDSGQTFGRLEATIASGSAIEVGSLVSVGYNKSAFVADSGTGNNDVVPASGVCISISGVNIEYSPLYVGPVPMIRDAFNASRGGDLFLHKIGRVTNDPSLVESEQIVGKLLIPPSGGLAYAFILVSYVPIINK